jgi:hypothetical protein
MSTDTAPAPVDTADVPRPAGPGPLRALLWVAATVVSAGLLVVVQPSGGHLDHWWLLVAYLVPFVGAVEAVAALPAAWIGRWPRLGEVTVVASFVVFFGGFVPRMFARMLADDFDGFYALMRMATPMIILALALAYRLGGAGAVPVRRVAYASVLVMLSGLEDLLFWVWRGQPVPARWDWADHMTVLLGHVASRPEAYVFIAVHLAAALAVLTWRGRR